MAYCAHQDVSFLVRAVHSRQTELPLGKSALASLGHPSKRTFLFPAVLRLESCSRAELPVVLEAAPSGQGGVEKARPGWSTPDREMPVGHHREEMLESLASERPTQTQLSRRKDYTRNDCNENSADGGTSEMS
jgi:hypothetical protein